MYKFEKLIAWKKATELVEFVYEIKLPKSERFCLEFQLRRAVVSVPLNIAEGTSSNNDKELKRFLKIARGSLYETVAILKLIKKLHSVDVGVQLGQCGEVGRTISGLIRFLKSKDQKTKD